MKRFFTLFFLTALIIHATAQNFTGQWKGSFSDKSTSFVGWGGNRCDYVLELDCSGSSVSGYSYTYFSEGGKRYYTICKLKGIVNKANKSVEITETERTKTNVPNTIRNCFQIHRLTYFKEGDDESLEGSWVPAPKQEGDCGYGSTTLTRRLLQKSNNLYNNSNAITVKPPKSGKTKTNNTPQVKTTPKGNNAVPPPTKEKPVVPEIAKAQPPKNNTKAETVAPERSNNIQKELPQSQDMNLPRRNNTLVRTIEIENETFRADLYDNGEIDGDSISLIFNGKLILSKKRLSDKAITLTLNVDDKKDVNELVMYAENLGSIPPNTALMVVTDGNNRYEVRISSDLEKSGSIRFIHKPRSGQ